MILLIVISPLSANAAFLENEFLIVQFEPKFEKVAQKVLAVYPELASQLEQSLAWPMDFRTEVILKDKAAFQSRVKGKRVVAYAVSEKHRIVMDASKITRPPFAMGATLKHEMVHLLLHHHIPHGNLPKWLDEGLAQQLSGEVTEILMGEKENVLQRASLSRQLIPISQLNVRFPTDDASVLLAYAQSKSIVAYLAQKYGMTGVRALLRALKAGEPIRPAVSQCFAISLHALESAWQKDLKKSVTWIAFLGHNLLIFIFAFGGVVTVIAFIRFIIKKRAYQDDDEPLWLDDDDLE